MAPAVDADTQGTVDSLVEAVRQRDALMCFYWLEFLKKSGRRALSYPDTETGLCALETAVQPPDFAEPSDVLARLQAAHSLIIQVLLLAGADAWSACASGKSVWERAEAGGDAAAVALLEQWDKGGANWTDAEYAHATPVREGGLEDWLRLHGFDRETECVVWQSTESHDQIDEAIEAPAAVKQEPGGDDDVDVKPVIDRSESPHGYGLPKTEARRSAEGGGREREVKREVVDEPVEPELDFSFPHDALLSSLVPSQPLLSPSSSLYQPTPLPKNPATNASWPARPASSSSSYNPAPPPFAARLAAGPSTSTPSKLNPRVEYLAKQRSAGILRPLRAKAGQALLPALDGPFSQLASEAERLGIVRMGPGDVQGQDWIELVTLSPATPSGQLSLAPSNSRITSNPVPRTRSASPAACASSRPSRRQSPARHTSLSSLPGKYRPLVDFIQRRVRETGRPWIARTELGQEFRQSGLYSNFGEWARGAEKLGLVQLGMGFEDGTGDLRVATIRLTPAQPRRPSLSPTRWAPAGSAQPRLPPMTTRVPAHTHPRLRRSPSPPPPVRVRDAQVWIGGIVGQRRSLARLRDDLTDFLDIHFCPRSAIIDMAFDPASLAGNYHAFVFLEPGVDITPFLERARRFPPMFGKSVLHIRENTKYRRSGQVRYRPVPFRSPSPPPRGRSRNLPLFQQRDGSPRRGTPPHPSERTLSSRCLSRSRSRSSERRRSRSPFRRWGSTQSGSKRYAPPTSLVALQSRVPLSPVGAEPAATPTPPAPSSASAIPIASAWLQDELMTSSALQPTKNTSTPLDDARRVAALSTLSDLHSLPTASAPLTFWEPIPASPTASFSRTLPLTTTFGYVPPTLASRAMAGSLPVYADGLDRRATLTSFLESQCSGTTTHYDAFLGRIEDFSNENVEFSKLARELAQESELAGVMVSEESDELDEGSDDDDALMVDRLVLASPR